MNGFKDFVEGCILLLQYKVTDKKTVCAMVWEYCFNKLGFNPELEIRIHE